MLPAICKLLFKNLKHMLPLFLLCFVFYLFSRTLEIYRERIVGFDIFGHLRVASEFIGMIQRNCSIPKL